MSARLTGTVTTKAIASEAARAPQKSQLRQQDHRHVEHHGRGFAPQVVAADVVVRVVPVVLHEVEAVVLHEVVAVAVQGLMTTIRSSVISFTE